MNKLIEKKILDLNDELSILKMRIQTSKNMEELLTIIANFQTVFVQYTYLNMFRVSQGSDLIDNK